MKAMLTADELLTVAREAEHELEKASTKDEVAEVFDHYAGTLGYKIVARLLLGSDATTATAKWRAKLG